MLHRVLSLVGAYGVVGGAAALVGGEAAVEAAAQVAGALLRGVLLLPELVQLLLLLQPGMVLPATSQEAEM